MGDTGGIDAADVHGLTERVIGCAFNVHNVLGYGYLEKVYENALAHELGKAGLSVEQQRRIDVCYDGVSVGEYVADLIVDAVVLVEVKAVRAVDDAHLALCLNYLTATGLPVGLILNFSRRVTVERVLADHLPL